MKDYEIINVTVYDPSKNLFKTSANEKAECKVFYCKNKNSCELYRRGQCINVGNFFKMNCVYGKTQVSTGFTKRALKFRSWIEDKKEKYNNFLYKLNSAKNKLAIVGDYVYLPYAHMDMNKSLEFTSHSGFMAAGSGCLPKASFNANAVKSIVNFRPQGMLGGEIKSYQKEQVPKFLNDLKVIMPDLYEETAKENEKIKSISEKYSYVGRRAYIHSLKSGVEIVSKKGLSKGTYLWDGEHLICRDYDPLCPIVDFSEVEFKLKPKQGQSVEITNDNQVDDDTEFDD